MANNHPPCKPTAAAILDVLRRNPKLADASNKELGDQVGRSDRVIKFALRSLHESGAIELHYHRPKFRGDVARTIVLLDVATSDTAGETLDDGSVAETS